MLTTNEVVFLLDVDNTLLDNDRFGADLDARLEQAFGAGERDRYRAIYDELRDELGYAEYLGALQKFRTGLDDDRNLLQMSAFMLEYPFDQRLYPRALDVIAHLQTLGVPVVLSDGDTRALGARLTTVFVRQGHYAADSEHDDIDPPPDITIERITDLLELERSHFLAAVSTHAAATNQEQA